MVDFQTKTERAADALRAAIANGEIRPGNRIQAEAFGESIGLSATPIREAIRLLEAEGIIEIVPHRGAYVTTVSRQDFIEVYRMRGALESLAIQIVVERSTPAERKALFEQAGRYQAAFRREVERGNEVKARVANRDLHFALYGGVGTRLYASIANLWAVFPFDTLWLIPARAALAVDEHDVVLEAIRDGRADDAAQAMRHHIEGAARLFLDQPEAADYFSDN